MLLYCKIFNTGLDCTTLRRPSFTCGNTCNILAKNKTKKSCIRPLNYSPLNPSCLTTASQPRVDLWLPSCTASAVSAACEMRSGSLDLSCKAI